MFKINLELYDGGWLLIIERDIGVDPKPICHRLTTIKEEYQTVTLQQAFKIIERGEKSPSKQ